MSNPANEREREELALDALIAAAFNQELCDEDANDLDELAQSLTAEDRAALNARSPDLIASLFSGERQPQARPSQSKRDLANAMNRSEEEEPPTDKAREEMEQNVQDEEERGVADGGQPSSSDVQKDDNDRD